VSVSKPRDGIDIFFPRRGKYPPQVGKIGEADLPEGDGGEAAGAMLAKRLVCFLLTVVLSLFATAAHALPDIQDLTTPAGIRVWLVEDKSVPLISMSYAFEAGSTTDPAGREGAAAMTAALLDQGAGNLDARAFKARQDDLSVRLGFSASHDRFSGSLATLSANRDAAFELLRLALAEPRFDADRIEQVRQSMQTNIRRGDENPQTVAGRALNSAMFAGHPYGRPANGTRESLAALGADDLRAAVPRLFRRDHLTVVVVGDVKAAEVVALIDRVFAALPQGEPPPGIPDWSPPTGSRTIVRELSVPQSVVYIATPGILRSDPDWYAAQTMNRVLGGGGQQSWLFTEVREKRGLAYGASSGLRAYRKAGLFVATTASANERVAEAIAVAREQILRMPREGISDADLADAKTWLKGAFALSLDSGGAIASMLHSMLLDGLPTSHLAGRDRLIDAVTRDDVLRVARRMLREDLLTTIVVGKPVGVTASE
jgi:zinc protease